MYINKEYISQCVENFKSHTYKKPEQIGLFFYFKAKGLNEYFYTKYEKWGEMDSSERIHNLLNLYDLAGVFDYEKETGKKRCALFPFSISNDIKSPAFYNGATAFGGLGSRISDTLDNALVSTFVAKNTAKSNEIRLQNNYVELLYENYLLRQKISIELFAAWCFKFWNIEMPNDSKINDFNDVIVLAFLERYHISTIEYENMFYFGKSQIEGAASKVTGEELRELIKFGKEVFPEVEDGRFTMLYSGDRNLSEEDVKKYLSQREGETLAEEDILRILRERDADIEMKYLESVSETNETNVVLSNDTSVDKKLLVKQLVLQYKNSDDKYVVLNIFGLKYAKLFINGVFSVQDILEMAELYDDNNEKEINRGIEIYKALLLKKSGVNVTYEELSRYALPDRTPRTQTTHPLNFIVYGAPGTGKTYSMVEYALAIIENETIDEFRKNNKDRASNVARYKELVKTGQIVFTTFHQNYDYEEFIQGFRPDKDSKTMAFKTVDGVFKVIADKALNDTEDKNYVIIIDEINRANISKVFGELITLIENDKRWGELNETSVTLQSGVPFAVPNNLYIVGTMNSADKSISLIDAALRRRFDFIEQKPDSSLVPDGVLRKVFDNINENLVRELDSTDLLVGHSYFMNKKESDLCGVLNNNIIPLLYEYFYDNRKKVAAMIKDAIDKSGANIEIVDEKVGRLSVKTKEE